MPSETSLIHEARVRMARFTPRVLLLSALAMAAVFTVAAVVTPQPGRFAPAFAELDLLAEDAAIRDDHIKAYRWWVDDHIAITADGEVKIVDATTVPAWVLRAGYEAALIDDEQARIIYFRLLENMIEQSGHRNASDLITLLRRYPAAVATLLHRPLLRKALWRMNGAPLPVTNAVSAAPVALTLGLPRSVDERAPIAGEDVETLVRRLFATFRDQIAIVDPQLVDGLLARSRVELQTAQLALADLPRIASADARERERARLTDRIARLTRRVDGLAARVVERSADLPGQVPMSTLLRGYGTLDDVIWLHLEALAALGIAGFEVELALPGLGQAPADPVRDCAYGRVRWVVALIPQTFGVDFGAAAVKAVAFDPYQGVPILDAAGGLLDLGRWRLGGGDLLSRVNPALARSLPYTVSADRLPSVIAGTSTQHGAVRVYGLSPSDATAALDAAQQARTQRADAQQTLNIRLGRTGLDADRSAALLDALLTPFRARDAAGVARVLRREVERIARMLTDDTATAADTARIRDRLATLQTAEDLQQASNDLPPVAALFAALEAIAPTDAEVARHGEEAGYLYLLCQLGNMLDRRLYGGLWHVSLPALGNVDAAAAAETAPGLRAAVADLCWPAWLRGTGESGTARLRVQQSWPFNWSMLQRTAYVDAVMVANTRPAHLRLTRGRAVDQDLLLTRSQALLYARPDVGIDRYPNFNWLSYNARDFNEITAAHDVWTPCAGPGQLGLVHTSMLVRHARRYQQNLQRAVNALYGSGSHYMLSGTHSAAAEDLSRFLERTLSGAIDRRSITSRSGRVDRALLIESAMRELRAHDDDDAMRATEEYLRRRTELDRRAAAAPAARGMTAFEQWLYMPHAAETAELWDVSRAPGCFVRQAAFLAGRAYWLDGHASEASRYLIQIGASPGPLQAAAQLRPLDLPAAIDVLSPPARPLEPLVRYGR